MYLNVTHTKRFEFSFLWKLNIDFWEGSRFWLLWVICRWSLTVGWGRGCCYAKHYSVKNCQLGFNSSFASRCFTLTHFSRLCGYLSICIWTQTSRKREKVNAPTNIKSRVKCVVALSREMSRYFVAMSEQSQCRPTSLLRHCIELTCRAF